MELVAEGYRLRNWFAGLVLCLSTLREGSDGRGGCGRAGESANHPYLEQISKTACHAIVPQR